jgi:predicted GIY-YIG superfamily endonuclease
MLASTLWIVEYSLSKKEFGIREIGACIEENLSLCMQRVASDHLFIGQFYAKESALIYIEGVKSRLTASSLENTLSAANKSKEERLLLYEEAVDLIKEVMSKFPYGHIKIFCKKANLTYNTVIGLVNGSLRFKTPEFVMQVLIALGYDVKMRREMEMKAREKEKKAEIITYFITIPIEGHLEEK